MTGQVAMMCDVQRVAVTVMRDTKCAVEGLRVCWAGGE